MHPPLLLSAARHDFVLGSGKGRVGRGGLSLQGSDGKGEVRGEERIGGAVVVGEGQLWGGVVVGEEVEG